MANYADRLTAAILDKNSRVCVGLDPRIESLPAELAKQAAGGAQKAAEACNAFCCAIIDAVAGCVVAVKPQAAFFEVLGPAGYEALWQVIAHARSAGLLVVLDAKRSDIGSTAAAYAQAYFRPPGGLTPLDAVTVNGYLGSDGVRPFIEAAADTDAGVYVLAKTSNPSSGELQDLPAETSSGRRLIYQEMGRLIAQWGQDYIGDCGYSAVGAVVGATYPEQLSKLRQALPTVPFLVPGYGAQGAGAEDVALAFGAEGLGAIVNSSRGIIFAYQREPYSASHNDKQFAAAAAAAAKDMKDEINEALGV